MGSVPGGGHSKSKTASKWRVAGGLALLGTGLLLAIPGIPGPGIPLVIAGLVILRGHFEWAGRALDWLRSKTQWLRLQGGASEKAK